MVDFNKMLEEINIPKQLLDKTEAVAKTLFGPSFDELGGAIADQVRARRWKNQLKIFENAQKLLVEKNINPKKVSLKVLAPLIEFASYEEEETLQTKWSNLIAHILTNDNEVLFHQNCISVLNKICSEEAALLDKIHKDLVFRKEAKRSSEQDAYEKNRKFISKLREPDFELKHPVTSFIFEIKKIANESNLPRSKATFIISNLISLGLMKWEIGVEVSAKKSSEDPKDDEIDIDVDVYNNETFAFTPFGDRFVQACKRPLDNTHSPIV